MDPASIYRRRAVEGSSPISLIVLLYQTAIQSLQRAIAALETGNIEARTTELNRAFGVVAELKAVLDYERGGQVAQQFARFYRITESRMLDASFRQDPAPLRELLEPWTQVLDAWRQADVLPPGAASVADPPPPSRLEHVSWQA